MLYADILELQSHIHLGRSSAMGITACRRPLAQQRSQGECYMYHYAIRSAVLTQLVPQSFDLIDLLSEAKEQSLLA